jgi:hypothetical protein
VVVYNHPNLIVRKALEFIEEFKTANTKPHAESEGSSSIQKWIAPIVGHVKINWDATVNKAGGKMGIRVIVRDHEGEVFATFLAIRQHIINPATTEATTALRTTFFARELEHQQVELEGDAIQIVHALNKEGKIGVVMAS